MHKQIGLYLSLSAAMASCALGQADPYASLPSFEFGGKTDISGAILTEIQAAKPADLAAIEKKLLAAMAAQGATHACKKFVCETLRMIGSEACVAPVLTLMNDEKTADLARFTLEGNPSGTVDDGLTAAFKSAQGKVKTGILNTLAARRSPGLPGLAKECIESGKTELAVAGIQALHRCGCLKALETLLSAKSPAGLEGLREQTICDIAVNIARNGSSERAVAIFEEQFNKGTCLPAVIASLNGIIDHSKNPLPCLAKALRDPRAKLALAAAKAAPRIQGGEATRELCSALPELKPEIQVAVLASLGARADKSALPAIQTALSSTEESVRAQAALALEKIGDPSVIPALITMASAEDEAAAAARWTLGRMNAGGIDDTMTQMLNDPDAKKMRIAALTLTARGNLTIMPTLLKLAESNQPETRNAALDALEGFAAGNEVPALITLLQKAPRDTTGKIATVLWKATKGFGADDTRYVKMWEAAAGSPDTTLAALLPLATAAGGPEPLQIVTRTLTSGNTNLLDPAARTLFNWPKSDAIEPTLDFMKKTTDAKYKILGARSVVRILNDKKCNLPDKKRIGTLEQVLPLMDRAEDKKMIEDEIVKFKEGKHRK